MKLRKDRKEQRKVEGAARNAKFQAMSKTEKLAHLDKQNAGPGLGAKRQRAKLDKG